jgi:tetratricopeptide (TPR) repeat protein
MATEPAVSFRVPLALRGLQGALGLAAVLAGFWLVVRPFQASQAAVAGERCLVAQPAQAMQCFKQATALRPWCERHWAQLGTAATLAAQQERDPATRQDLARTALHAFEKAAELVPVNPYNDANLGKVLALLAREGLAQPRAAFDHFDGALTRDPTNITFYVDAARAAAFLADRHREYDYARRGLEINPRIPNCRAQLGLLAFREGRYAEAERQLEQALAGTWNASDEVVRTQAALAEVKLMLGRYERAALLAQKVLKKAPDWPAPRLLQAKALELMGRRTEALAAYQLLLQEHPDFSAGREAFNRFQAGAGLPFVPPNAN